MPTPDQERATTDHPALTVPNAVASLDDLRTIALMVGNVQPTAPIQQEKQKLVQVWLALGKPLP